MRNRHVFMYIVIFYVNFGLFISVCVCECACAGFSGKFLENGEGGGKGSGN